MHIHIAFGEFVLIDLRVALTLFHRDHEVELEEVPAAPLGFQLPRGGEPVAGTDAEPQ
ncbi:hypothetical protein GCM10028799_57190 [Kribbella italica]